MRIKKITNNNQSVNQKPMKKLELISDFINDFNKV